MVRLARRATWLTRGGVFEIVFGMFGTCWGMESEGEIYGSDCDEVRGMQKTELGSVCVVYYRPKLVLTQALGSDNLKRTKLFAMLQV